jgi:hypothetical protein
VNLSAIVRTTDGTRLTVAPVALKDEAALADYAADIFRNYPHADRVEANDTTPNPERWWNRLYIYRAGMTIHRVAIPASIGPKLRTTAEVQAEMGHYPRGL